DAYPPRAQRIAWQTELWRVERIEHLEAELQAVLFAEREVLQRRRVEIDSPRPGHHRARGVAISKTRWRRKGSRIEPLNPAHSARRRFAFLRIGQPPVADDIGPQILAVGVVAQNVARPVEHRDAEGRATLQRGDRRKRPTAERLIQKSVFQPAFAFPKWQLIDRACDHSMADVVG